MFGILTTLFALEGLGMGAWLAGQGAKSVLKQATPSPRMRPNAPEPKQETKYSEEPVGIRFSDDSHYYVVSMPEGQELSIRRYSRNNTIYSLSKAGAIYKAVVRNMRLGRKSEISAVGAGMMAARMEEEFKTWAIDDPCAEMSS